MADSLDPQRLYEKLILSGDIDSDPSQAKAVIALQNCYQNILLAEPESNFFWKSKRYPLVPGLYLWGGVGRGKTWLFDLLFDALPIEEKKRQHFHLFMQDVHQRLSKIKGKADPLPFIAKQLSKEMRVLFLDEFHVVDIADAVILAQLLRGLFESGITLVTTSNVPPNELYNDGIQRVSFLPAIELIQKNTEVVKVGGVIDYRLQTMISLKIYLIGLNNEMKQKMLEEFQQLTIGEQVDMEGNFVVAERDIPFIKKVSSIIWFSFEALCLSSRKASDYLEIARCFHTVFIDSVPLMDGSRDDSTRRFISLIDVLYDQRVKLIINAELPPEKLYGGERLAFEFQRTASRLREMQSKEYLALEHRP